MYSLVFLLVLAAATAQQFEQFHWPYRYLNAGVFVPTVNKQQWPYYQWNYGTGVSNLNQWPYYPWNVGFVPPNPYYYGIFGGKIPHYNYNLPVIHIPGVQNLGTTTSLHGEYHGGITTPVSYNRPFHYGGDQVVGGGGTGFSGGENYNVNFPVTGGQGLYSHLGAHPFTSYLNQKIPILEVY